MTDIGAAAWVRTPPAGAVPAAAPRGGCAPRLPAWALAVGCVAAGKAALSTAVVLVPDRSPHPIPAGVFFLVVAVFAVAGAYLVAMSRGDARAAPLGMFFLLVASSFSERLLVAAAAGVPAAASLLLALRNTPVESYLAFFFWAFVRDFPRPESSASRLADGMLRASVAAGTLLLAANLVLRGVPGVEGSRAGTVLGWLDAEGALYWTVVFGLVVPAYPYALWRARRASPDERRRVGLLTAGLTLGFGPSLVVVVLSGLPAVDRLLSSPEGLRAVGAVVYPALLSIPLTTAYAVLVHRALDVRLLVRNAVRYGLARYTIISLSALPAMGLLLLLYARRQEPLGEVFAGQAGAALGGLALAGGIAAWFRVQIMDSLDRRFFREQYDARLILEALVQGVGACRSPAELAVVVEREVDRALHLRSLLVLVLDPAAGALTSHRAAPMPINSRMARRLEAGRAPIRVHGARPAAWLERLPGVDRAWLDAADARLLVPMAAPDGSLLGVMALGEKRSELPFTGEDLRLLSTIAASAALSLEHRIGASPAARLEGAVQAAQECGGCGRIGAPDAARCEACGGSTTSAAVPLILNGKFRLTDRIGSGGMGVVYRGVDLALDREVAIKTLPRVSPSAAARLRAEARAMAQVHHPNLALIFAAESWSGVPMLVVEYLPGGTLADRLAAGRMRPVEAAALMCTLLPALERLHAGGILHRDVKPSNIGFAGDGAPKLLDFGLARALEDDGAADAVRADGRPASPGQSAAAGGTPLYLSPEAARGEPPDVSADVWALSMAFYEAVAGRHPYTGQPAHLVLLSVLDGAVPDVRSFAPDVPAPLAALLADALHTERARRLCTASELHRRLECLRPSL